MKDMGGRRCLADRRRCSIRDYFPERRSMRFRREEERDRRSPIALIAPFFERRASFIGQDEEEVA